MRLRFALVLVAIVGVAAPGVASADCVHVVAPGESLTSIAATDGLTVEQLAAANGLSLAEPLFAGICLTIPPQGGGSGTTGNPVVSAPSGGSYVVQPGDTLTAIAARAGMSVSQLAAANGINPLEPLLIGTVLQLSGGVVGDGDNDGDDSVGSGSTAASTAPGGGSYVVQPGDTLTAIAARAATTVVQLAANNGLDPNAFLLSGTVLRLSGSAPSGPSAGGGSGQAANAAVFQPVGAAAQGSATGPPYPTPETLPASEVGAIASYEGVPPALAEAIAYQESGFNNNLVSSADARGVMQILPGTWSWIGQDLATPPPLGVASAAQNVRAGTLLLHSLLQATGGNQALAAAGYYQGLPSVQQHGEFLDTQQYVNDVLSLEQQFGGG
jgi:LysM repeat protein